MAKRTKVPRASIACTILDDPEYMGLMQTSAGRDAFALFCALLAAAKAQDNKGSFKHPSPVVAAIIRWPVVEYEAALATLCAETNWVSCGDQAVTIRSFKKWNSWGGKREQDDSKSAPKMGPRLQQDDSKTGAKPATPVSVSVSVSEELQLPCATSSRDEPEKPKEPKGVTYPEDFEVFWSHYPRRKDKGAALKAWKKLNAADKQAAIDRAEWVKGCWSHWDPDEQRRQFVQAPATWLNARGWEDEDSAVELMARGR